MRLIKVKDEGWPKFNRAVLAREIDIEEKSRVDPRDAAETINKYEKAPSRAVADKKEENERLRESAFISVSIIYTREC